MYNDNTKVWMLNSIGYWVLIHLVTKWDTSYLYQFPSAIERNQFLIHEVCHYDLWSMLYWSFFVGAINGHFYINFIAFISFALISLELLLFGVLNREEEELAVFSLENATISIQDVYMMLLQIINYLKFWGPHCTLFVCKSRVWNLAVSLNSYLEHCNHPSILR